MENYALQPLQGKHLLAEFFVKVFSVTRLAKMMKNSSGTTFAIGSGGFSEGFYGFPL